MQTLSSTSSHGLETEESDGVKDIYDAKGTGYFYNVLVQVYEETRVMVCRLAKQYYQPVPDFPKL
jgi:hypothetical protein